jgi:hypothetical protein
MNTEDNEGNVWKQMNKVLYVESTHKKKIEKGANLNVTVALKKI